MPSELRHLLFRPSEVVQAVKEYYRRMRTATPTGLVVFCGPEARGAGATVRFRITVASNPVDGEAMPNQDVLVDTPVLAAALILFCHDKKIPLPAQADKSLQVFGDQVCLLATLHPKVNATVAGDAIYL